MEENKVLTTDELEDIGVSVSKVTDSEFNRKLNNGLKIDFEKVSKTVAYFKEFQEQIQREEARKRKNYFVAGKKETLMNKLITSKSNLVMAMSGIALVVSTIALVNSQNGAAKAFIESEEALSVTKLNAQNDSMTGSAVPEELQKKLDDAKNKGGIITATDSKKLTDDQYKQLEGKLMTYIETRLNSTENNKFTTDNGEKVVSGGYTMTPEEMFRFTTNEQREIFAHAVRDAMDFLRIEDNRRNLQMISDKFKDAQNTVPNGRHLYGNPQARFIIQEFSDLECPYCKGFFETPKAVADASNGQVAVEWVHTPLSFHEPAATQEAIATECVFEQKGNKGFWTSLQYIFDTTYGNGKGSGVLASLAESFELDSAKYLKCINSPEVKEKIEKAKEFAASKGVNSTPSSIILDTKTGATTVVGGAQDQSVIMEAIEKMNEQSALAQVQPQGEANTVTK